MLNRILIIDDSLEIKDFVKYCISRNWPAVEIDLYDPAQGLPAATFDWDQYDLLILDYQLGLVDEDGLDWLKILSNYSNSPPILFMTAYSHEDIAVQAIKLGAEDYLNKDELSAKRLSERIATIIGEELQKTNVNLMNTTGVTRSVATLEDERTMVMNADMLVSADDTASVSEETQMFSPKKGTLPEEEVTKAGDQNTKSSAVDTHKLIESELPGYRVIDKVGEGGMANIFLAEREEDNLQVVLKVLDIANVENKESLRRFIREYRLIGQLDHPNIARIYERAFAQSYAYIAIEYCPNGDLAQRLKQPLSTETAVSYMRQIGEGIGAAHKVGIIHRDMKPGNILFRADDSLAITDFGIAKILGDTSELTEVGQIVGTMFYISPEQIRGTGINKYSDLYSLGVIFYKMLTGEFPFYGESVEQILQAHLMESAPRLPKKLASFQPIIDGLLAKDPDERFQNAEEFIVGLEWE
jgi:DNA-binding response OmpR family regulator/tRNA A-37 threonylcarbamoyl transferase component Bud32